MGGYCSNLNRQFIYLPEAEEEKLHGRTKTTINKEGKLRVYSRKYRSKTVTEIDKKKELAFNRDLRRRYSDHYNNNFELINKTLMFTSSKFR